MANMKADSRSGPPAILVWLVFVALGVAAPSGLSWAADSCHIDPLGRELPDPELRKAPFYDTVEECEAANMKYYGGSGRCHCLPTGFLKKFPNFSDRPPDEFGSDPQPYFIPRP